MCDEDITGYKFPIKTIQKEVIRVLQAVSRDALC